MAQYDAWRGAYSSYKPTAPSKKTGTTYKSTSQKYHQPQAQGWGSKTKSSSQSARRYTGGGGNVPQQYSYSGGSGGHGGSGFNWEDYIPELPQAPVVTAALIAEWLKRAQDEAALQYDPQKLAINQQLATSELAANQQKAGIPVAYDEIIKEIQKWQDESMKSEQQRHYARGFGRSGVLLEQEQEIGEKALEETTAAKTEQARLMADIDAQVALLKNQAGEKQTGLEAARATYITQRQSELRDAYEQNQQALAQQQFANQMAIAEFGLSAETQAFNEYLQQSQLELDQWYANSLNSLSQESAVMNSAAAGSMPSANTNTYTVPQPQSLRSASSSAGSSLASSAAKGSTQVSSANPTIDRLKAWLQTQNAAPYKQKQVWAI